MKKLLSIAIAAVLFTCCKTKTSESSLSSEMKVDSMPLYEQLIAADSVDHRLTSILDTLCSIEFGDYDMYNNDTLMAWKKRIEPVLVEMADSLSISVSQEEKPRYVCGILSSCLDVLEERCSSSLEYLYLMGDRIALNRYVMTDISSQILEIDPDFRKEMDAWSSFHSALGDYCSSLVEINYFGGSIGRVLSTTVRAKIVIQRLDDIKGIYSLYTEPDCPSALFLDLAKDLFVRSADEAVARIPQKSDDDEYMDEYKRVQNNKLLMRVAYDNWIRVRQGMNTEKMSLSDASQNEYEHNTALLLRKLSEIIVSCFEK
ncbi:MAG: hypothetical protein MJZ69_03475 [Bacteroidaceae bacterium]|nr:hypothetical protein [Bacteroidaceae bacterium]